MNLLVKQDRLLKMKYIKKVIRRSEFLNIHWLQIKVLLFCFEIYVRSEGITSYIDDCSMRSFSVRSCIPDIPTGRQQRCVRHSSDSKLVFPSLCLFLSFIPRRVTTPKIFYLFIKQSEALYVKHISIFSLTSFTYSLSTTLYIYPTMFEGFCVLSVCCCFSGILLNAAYSIVVSSNVNTSSSYTSHQ